MAEVNNYSTMANWLRPYSRPQTPTWLTGQQPQYTPIPATAPAYGADLPMTGADWEQMPMGTNGLAPGQGMFAGSAVNAPINGGMLPGATPGGFTDTLRSYGVIDSIDPTTGQRVGGWGGLALGAAQGLGSLYLGMQQYNLAKDSLAASKSQFERNFAAQKNTTNSALETRQDRRNAERNDAMATADYMSKYGVR